MASKRDPFGSNKGRAGKDTPILGMKINYEINNACLTCRKTFPKGTQRCDECKKQLRIKPNASRQRNTIKRQMQKHYPDVMIS